MPEPLALPTPDRLAALVSNVTQSMVGIKFSAASSQENRKLTWCTAVLPIPGARPLTVGLSSDSAGCAALGSAIFSCPPETVDVSMMHDSLRELLNMTAGLLKNLLGLDQALGLPRIVDAGEHPALLDSHSVVLSADHVGLVLWISES